MSRPFRHRRGLRKAALSVARANVASLSEPRHTIVLPACANTLLTVDCSLKPAEIGVLVCNAEEDGLVLRYGVDSGLVSLPLSRVVSAGEGERQEKGSRTRERQADEQPARDER